MCQTSSGLPCPDDRLGVGRPLELRVPTRRFSPNHTQPSVGLSLTVDLEERDSLDYMGRAAGPAPTLKRPTPQNMTGRFAAFRTACPVVGAVETQTD